MKKILLFFFILIANWISMQAQLQILEGDSQLEYKRIELKSNYFKILPIVHYSAENPFELKIEFALELYNDINEIIENTDDWLYIISDWDKMLEKSHSEGFKVERSPEIDHLIKFTNAVLAFQDEDVIEVDKFDNGFVCFQNNSEPIIFYLENIPNSIITLQFHFVHIATYKKKHRIRERPLIIEWKFRLPVISDETVVNCKHLEAQYSIKLNEIIKDKDITYFRRQVYLEGSDFDRLREEYKIFISDLHKAGEFRKVIANTPALDKCPELKSQLLLQIDQFLQQQGDLMDLEEKIGQQMEDNCKNYEEKYTTAINENKPSRNLEYFNSKINSPGTDVLKLEEEFQQFRSKNRSFQKLYDEISQDPKSLKCNILRDQLLQRISNFKTSEEEYSHIATWIDKEKQELLKDKELSVEKYIRKYKSDLAYLENKFRNFLSEYDPIKSHLDVAYDENNTRISILNEMKSKDSSDMDTIELAKKLLDSCIHENMRNLDIIDSISHSLTLLGKQVEILEKECKSTLAHLDRIQGLEKAKPILNGCSRLISEINQRKIEIGSFHDKTKANNKEISDLNDIFNPATGTQYLVNKYEPLFVQNYRRIIELADELNYLNIDFETKQYRKSYYNWVKKRFTERSKGIENKINTLSEEQDTLIESKKIEFEESNVNVYIEDINNFKQEEANLRLRLEHLASEIDKSLSRKFPYSYLILILLAIIILAFGARVYLNALRNKKREQAKKNNKTSSPESKITLKGSYENNLEKGKGLSEVREKIGRDYMEIDLNYEWDNSAVSKIFYKRECIIKTYRFFEDSVKSTDTNRTAFETGGYLIGRWDYNLEDKDKYDVSLEEFIEPGEDAKFSNYQLNYGIKIGLKLQKVLTSMKQKTGSDYIMTAWFHSHPGLKIFLSDFDLSVQEGFSREKESLKMVAIVLDPYTKNWDTGIFTYKADGSGMNNAQDSKRFFSLDKMYKWALHPEIEKPENYFTINLRHFYDDSICENVYFENSLILEIKRLFEDNNKAPNSISSIHIIGTVITIGYSHIDIILRKFKNANGSAEGQLEENNNGVVGLLECRCGEAIDSEEFISKLNTQNERIQVAILFDQSENKLTLVSRNLNLVFNKPSDNAEILLDNMIEWTRKRK